ncbi:MAG: segregation and condensation protein A [Geminicoccaceae bacterium]
MGASEADDRQLVLALDGFEGPIDVLLDLAKQQKVDLARISILQLAEQYAAFLEHVRAERLDVAADYLVMAAWLAYLKSRLLLPQAPDDEPDPGELARNLARKLVYLNTLRETLQLWDQRAVLGRDRLARPVASGIPVRITKRYDAALSDLLAAYARHIRRSEHQVLALRPRAGMSVEEALERLISGLGGPAWQVLDDFFTAGQRDGAARRGSLAAGLFATLQLAKEGRLELDQNQPFGPIHIRPRIPQISGDAETGTNRTPAAPATAPTAANATPSASPSRSKA